MPIRIKVLRISPNLSQQLVVGLWMQCLVAAYLLLMTPNVVWADSADVNEVWLSAQLNQQKAADVLLFLRQKDGRLLIAGKDWQQWRLRLPTIPAVKHDDEDYYLLDDIKGISYRINEADLSIALTIETSLFELTQLNGRNEIESLTLETPLGAFINYDLASSYADKIINSNAFIEGGIFSRWGVLESQFLLRDLENNHRYSTRLETTFTRDNLNQLTSLKIGDAVSSDIGLGGTVRFAGVQWARNFALQPSKITFPLPSIAGEAVLPSTVDIFINNAKNLSREVPIGAFSIQDIPVVSGQGEARMVIKDLLGREQVITQPYYASPSLLQVGLQEYAYELGFIRENYGVDNQNYGRLLAVVTHRVGITNEITSEFAGQFLQKKQMLSYGGVFLWPKLGVLHSALAASWHHQRGVGQAVSVAVEHQTSVFNWGLNAKSEARNFVNLASQDGISAIKKQTQCFVSMPLANYGSVSSTYTYQQSYDMPSIGFLQGTYSLSFGRWGALTASITHPLAQGQTTSQISLTMPLGFATSTNLTVQPENQQQHISIQRSVPTGTGFGYTFAAERGRIARDEAVLALQNSIGTYLIRATQQEGQLGGAASVVGGAAFLGGEAFLSRRINNSFAVVQVPNYSHVRVYKDNQLIGKTGKKGSVLVPQLRPYQKNFLRIEASDLPFDAQIETMQMDAIPAFRSGLLVSFPVQRSYGATLTLLLDNGEPVPAGAVVTKQGSSEAFPVGFRGELYVTGLAETNILTVLWKNQSCTLHVMFTQNDEPLPDLGSYTCKGVKP